MTGFISTSDSSLLGLDHINCSRLSSIIAYKTVQFHYLSGTSVAPTLSTGLEQLQLVDLLGNRNLTNFERLRDLPALRFLKISDCPKLRRSTQLLNIVYGGSSLIEESPEEDSCMPVTVHGEQPTCATEAT